MGLLYSTEQLQGYVKDVRYGLAYYDAYHFFIYSFWTSSFGLSWDFRISEADYDNPIISGIGR